MRVGDPSIAAVLRRLTHRGFRNKQPTERDRAGIVRILGDALAGGGAVSFLAYWGCGVRDEPNDIDRQSLRRLRELVDQVKVDTYLHPRLTTMLMDVHATVNRRAASVQSAYFSRVGECARERGFDVVWQSDVWRARGLTIEDVARHAEHEAFTAKWNALEIQSRLLARAAKHVPSDAPLVAARRYFAACDLERPALDAHFAGHIFVTYSSPEFDACLPSLPRLYVFSHRKGAAASPWFT
jgi:hypothetical protein